MIHAAYARLNTADRDIVDDAFRAASQVFRDANRQLDNGDASERAVEALAVFLIESGGAAREGLGHSLTAPKGTIHESYGA